MDTNNLKDYQKEVFKEFEELSDKIDALVTFKKTNEHFLHLKNILDEYISEIRRENIEGINSFNLDELKAKSREYVLIDSQIEIMLNYRETLIERILTWGIKREEFVFD
jgi:hypothetical protein